ncbi:MAG: helix-turn-helix domain-containing protein [Promethearchaeota archaeon]
MESVSEHLKNINEDKKIFKSGDLFKCILGLNELESNVFSYLLKNKHVTTIELANVLEKDRSSIQRSLQNLTEQKMIKRESMSLKDFTNLKGYDESNKRGYLYVYSAEELEYVKRKFNVMVEQWYHSMLKTIDTIENLFDCYKEDGEIC